MNKLKIYFENCYGIKSLTHEFDFTDVTKKGEIQKRNTFAIYAGNGVMKTSFANTFLDLSKEKSPSERVHNLTPDWNVTCDGAPLPYQDIFVIKSFIPQHEAENISKLLVSGEKKAEYDKIYSQIFKEKKSVIAKLNTLSGVKKTDIEALMVRDLDKIDLFECLELYDDKLVDYDFSAVKYDTIFNGDVLNLLKQIDVIENIAEYTKVYNELIENSPYFKHGIFNPQKADSVAKTLKKEQFFEAEHTVNLKGESVPMGETELFAKLNEANKSIRENSDLKKIQDLLTKKVSVRSFQAVLAKTPEIIPELGSSSLDDFKKKLWKSYILKNADVISPLLASYHLNKAKLEQIEHDAVSQQSKWEDIIDKFKDRFDVPFKIEIVNKKSAILGKESPNIVFRFDNDFDSYEEMSRDRLESLDVLSQGERRALYLLNIIFEVETRKQEQYKTLFIIDDIADSFDYKNKYAIISYLHEIAKFDFFYQIIMTHNFDFFRTIQTRVLGNSMWDNSFIAQKGMDGKIELFDGGHKNITDPFNYWRQNVNKNNTILIAMIPFVRNLIEYSVGKKDVSYPLLTNLLHMKDSKDGIPRTEDICISDIKPAFKQCINTIDLSNFDDSILIYDLILSEASKIKVSDVVDGFNLENKIVLSIAIRLMAEKFMWSKVTDKSSIKRSQTGHLFERYKGEFSQSVDESSNIETLDLVNIITPENIHINSFMYEPILDMSEHELKDLYDKTCYLQVPQ